VEGYTAVNALFWVDFFYYSLHSWLYRCPYVGTNTIYDTLNAVEPRGYTATFHFFQLLCQYPQPKLNFYLYVGPID